MTIRETPDSPEVTLRELTKGSFFGEKALLGYVIKQWRRYILCLYIKMNEMKLIGLITLSLLFQ